MSKKVALVLSSGGPRGFGYIGAIEELEKRDYEISSIAGTSIGSLVGGMYAAGKLKVVKEWLFSLDAWKVFTLMDFSISMNHLVKGDKVIEALKKIVPDTDIEDLKIPYRAIATDFYTGEEVIFDKGNLFQAIRASISIPSLFRPVKYGTRTLIDGGIANVMPLNRAVRTDGDIMVAFNVNDVEVEKIHSIMEESARDDADRLAGRIERERKTRQIINTIRHNADISLIDKLKMAGEHGQEVVKQAFSQKDKEEPEIFDVEDNYFSVLSRTFSLMNHVNSRLALQITPPDILVNMPFDAFGDIADYAKAKEISEAGRILMKEALDRYEEGQEE